MGDSRTAAALERIERALARIEAVADAPPPAAAGDREAQQALRGTVEEAISRLDRLLAQSEAR